MFYPYRTMQCRFTGVKVPVPCRLSFQKKNYGTGMAFLGNIFLKKKLFFRVVVPTGIGNGFNTISKKHKQQFTILVVI
jgi:hypothetical protein